MQLLPLVISLLLLQFSQSAAKTVEFTTSRHIVRVGGPKVQLLHHAKEKGGKHHLKAELSIDGVDLSSHFELCSAAEGHLCLQWGHNDSVATMRIKKDEFCYQLALESPDEDSQVKIGIPYGDAAWYGGPERFVQEWPIQTIEITKPEPLIGLEDNHQAVLEAYWLSSQGDSVYVRPNITLFWDSTHVEGEGMLGLISKNAVPYKPRGLPYLEVELCSFNNSVEAHYNAIDRYLGKPSAHPGLKMMTLPTYSTWAREKSNVNHEVVVNFTDSVVNSGYLMGTIEIDDKWETCYGNFEINKTRFPNMKETTDYIHSKGGRVTVWAHPFVNTDCDFYKQCLAEGRLVLNANGSAVSHWWNGEGGVIDYSNTTTRDWWVKRLMDLKEANGFDGYKIDGGETSFMPQPLPQLSVDPSFYPDAALRSFAEAAAAFGPDIEARVGHGTQDVPVYLRMIDKDSVWGLDNGLQSVITTTLQMSMVGYPFVLPDMIGGNAYGIRPSQELFIRWVQANAFLPVMQFSIFPWDYNTENDTQVADISKKYLDLHTQYADVLMRASNDTLADGRPLIAPVWWFSPDDPETFSIRDQFMVTDGLLVAPVLEQSAVQRDIYLPAGSWISPRNETLQGPQWLRGYSAPLDFLPYFIKA